MAQDKYRSYAELAARERDFMDYQRVLADRGSRLAVIAPHGGGIEPGTSEVARALAGNELSFYLFDGLKAAGNADLHITSGSFDEPLCTGLVHRVETVVTIHGCADIAQVIWVGGQAHALGDAAVAALRSAGFTAGWDEGSNSGMHPANICNRCRSRRGLQLELSLALREALFQDLTRSGRQHPTALLARLIGALRPVLLEAARLDPGEREP